jgi:hypothetical protein
MAFVDELSHQPSLCVPLIGVAGGDG